MEISKEQAKEMLRQNTRRMGLLFLSLAKRIIEGYGEEGKNIILEGLRDFGHTRGERIAEKVKKDGKSLTLENFFEYYDSPVIFATDKIEHESSRPGRIVMRIPACALATLAKEEDEIEIGKLYCEQDFSMIKGYNLKFELEKTASLMQGSDYCEFVYHINQEV